MNEAKWCELNNAIHTNLFDSSSDVIYDLAPDQLQKKKGVDAALDYVTKCINKSVKKVVPDKENAVLIKRRVSDETRALYEQRTAIFSQIAASGHKVKKSMRRR